MKFGKSHYRIGLFILSEKIYKRILEIDGQLYYKFPMTLFNEFAKWERSNRKGPGMVPETCNRRLRDIKTMFRFVFPGKPAIIDQKKYKGYWLLNKKLIFFIREKVGQYERKLREKEIIWLEESGSIEQTDFDKLSIKKVEKKGK